MVMNHIVRVIRAGNVLATPDVAKSANYTVLEVSQRGILFQIGKKNPSELFVPAECLEGSVEFLKGKNWVEIGSAHQKAKPGTLEEYLDMKREQLSLPSGSSASYVAPVLERSGLAEIYRRRPNRVRLRDRDL